MNLLKIFCYLINFSSEENRGNNRGCNTTLRERDARNAKRAGRERKKQKGVQDYNFVDFDYEDYPASNYHCKT